MLGGSTPLIDNVILAPSALDASLNMRLSAQIV